MTSQQKLIFFAVFGLLCAPTSPLVGRAAAWQCAELTEYVEMWDDSDQDPLPDTLGVYARGTADAAGDPCHVTVRTYILAPNNTELASALASGIGQATSTAVAHLDDFASEGAYTGKTEGWSQGVHYGCSWKSCGITSFTANYIYAHETTNYCWFQRCNVGNCGTGVAKKSKFPGGVCPGFAKLHVLRVDWGFGIVHCLFTSPIAIPNCAA
jgi:hypothetical protein